jgi:gamma-glutamyltranspeptidase/glutathione hydrolase
VLEYNMDAGSAVSAPRIHHQWLPDELRVEPFGLDVATIAELRRRGHKIVQRSPWGNANAIVVTPDGNLEGAADPRGEGSPVGSRLEVKKWENNRTLLTALSELVSKNNF